MSERTLAALIVSCAMLMAGGRPAAAQTQPNSVQQPRPKLAPAALPNTPEDANAERELLNLANESRQQQGVLPLRPDASLTDAARDHARLMVEGGTLSHQFAGEPPLLQRIAEAGSIRLDRAGENVAYNATPQSTHDALMHSPPHRENLLDPGFNAAGIAAIWSNGRLYVVEDFGHELPAYSPQQTRQVVARAIGGVRTEAGLFPLTEVAASGLDNAVCSLSRETRLNPRPLNVAYPSRGVITYTQSRPEVLPPAAERMLRGGGIRQFAVGACYARDARFPTGTYWVAILLN